jgi:hypothetical protein
MHILSRKRFTVFVVLSTIIALVNPIWKAEKADAIAAANVAGVYLDAPMVQGSYAVNYGGLTENFNSQSGTPGSGTVLNVGTIASGTLTIGSSGYGASSESSSAVFGGTLTKFATAASSGVTITFSQPVKYVGFDWQAGNSGNTVTFRSGGNDIASLTTDSMTALVGSFPANYATNTDSITAQNGSRYLKKYYFGNPQAYSSLTPTSQNSGSSSGEPFAYIHAFALDGQYFDSIRLSGAGFEFDNLTVSTQDVPINSSLVFMYNVTSNCVASQYDSGNVHTLKYTGSSVCSFNPPSWVHSIQVVAVAGGGGGGGSCVGGGGGAGGFYRNDSFTVNALVYISIGSGGGGGSYVASCQGTRGTNGGNSTLSVSGTTTTITGGGGGGVSTSNTTGQDGGSGGGGSGSGASVTTSGGNGVSGQGKSGGSGQGGVSGNPGGGGGGYSTAGGNVTSINGGNGGSGTSFSIFGSTQHFAGGGGGASDLTGGTGGESCGGNGASGNTAPTSATGFGCGGGGGDGVNGGSAGSNGVVFITYLDVYDQSIAITSGPAANSTVSTSSTSISAYSTSGLQLTYTIDASTSSTCSIPNAPLTVDSGTVVTIILNQANSNCTININQPGSSHYNAATQVQRTFVSQYGIVVSCSGVGSLVNGDFENIPGSPTLEANNTYGTETIGLWHGYGANSNPKQILFVYGASDTHTSTFKLSGWNTTAGDGYIEIQRVDGTAARTDGTQGVDAVGVVPASGSYHAELAARQISTLYQDVATLPGSVIRWSLKHRARATSGSDTMQVQIGTTSSQTLQTVNARRTPTNNVYLAPTYSTSVDSGFTPTTTISTSLANGWREYSGAYTVPAGQTLTRFAFVGTSGTSVGNLLDDIKFSPLIACPASFSVVAGRSTTINPFDINNNQNTTGNDSEDSYGWSDAFVSETLTATAGTLSRASLNGVSNRAIVYSAPSIPGTYLIDYTISNPQGDLSNSRYTVTVVPDSKTRAPSELPIDPRTTNYNLQLAQVTTATTNVIACIQESNSSGAVTSGNLRFDVGASGAVDTTISNAGGGVTVVADRTNSIQLTGPISAVNSVLTTLRIYRSDTPARLSSIFYIRFSSVVTGLTLYNQSDCRDAQSSQIKVLKVRPIPLTQLRSFTVLPKNGRQNN